MAIPRLPPQISRTTLRVPGQEICLTSLPGDSDAHSSGRSTAPVLRVDSLGLGAAFCPSLQPSLTFVVQSSVKVVAPSVEASSMLNEVPCPGVPSSREA